MPINTPWDDAYQAAWTPELAAHRMECPTCFDDEEVKPMRYEIKEADNDAGFYFVQVANNNEVLVTSETYTRKSDAMRGAYTAAGALADKDVQILDKTFDDEDADQ